MIQVYVYRKSDGLFLYQDTGSTDGVVFDITDDKDFTLTQPPDHEHDWRWQTDKWVKVTN